jgi:hypothetical protein
MGLAIHNFEDYLKAQNKRNIKQIMCYVRQFAGIVESGDATPIVHLQSGTTIRRHVLEALTVYAKYRGVYSRWCYIRKSYSLHWTNGDESLQSLQRFFNPNYSLDSMLGWVKQVIQALPAHMAVVIKLNCLLGVRPSECIAAIRLIKNTETFKILYNHKQQCLEYWRYPELFLRHTKKCYLSFITHKQLSAIGIFNSRTPTLRAIQSALKRRQLSTTLNFCRRIFASWLHREGISDVVIDMLQGRTGKSVLVNHYLAPDNTLQSRVLAAIDRLKNEL